MENKSLVLGSSSQQRKQILLSVGLSFQVVSPDVDESFEENLSPESVVVDIAKRKAEAVRQKVAENHWIIAADTGIILDNRLVGKPQDKVVANQNLDKISGATHTVVSGVALYLPNKKIESQAVFTDVKFRQLREKLELEGLFYKERKKKLPLRPKKIILVTSREGAALRDMLPILSMRIPFVELTIIHTLVQGEFAPRSIERALLVAEENNRMNSPADLIILSRGGGSNEDLSAFNDEIVIRAIDNCSIPILTAIGHEIDSSLSDLVSDDFSSTPTSAAEKVCRNWDIILERFMRFPSEMERYVKMILKNRKDEVAFYERMRILEEPTLYIQELQQKIDMLFENLLKETKYVLSDFRNRIFSILPRLRVVSPLSLHSSKVKTMEGYIERIEICIEKIFHAKSLEVKNLILRLESVSPISILARGYSLTYREKDHSLIRSIQQVENQELLQIKLSDGALDCRVEKINQKGETK